MSTSQIPNPIIPGYEPIQPPPNDNNNTPTTPSHVVTATIDSAAITTTTEETCCELNAEPLILSTHDHDNNITTTTITTTTPVIPIITHDDNNNNNTLLIANETTNPVIPHHDEDATAAAPPPELSTHDDTVLDLSQDDGTTTTTTPPPPPTTTHESMETFSSSHAFPDVPSIPLTTTTTTHAAPPSTDHKSQQPPPLQSPPKDPPTQKRGRRKGDTFKHVTNAEIQTWCLDLFRSQLAIRPFCLKHGLQSKKSTIGRHFKDSGLQRLRMAKKGREEAEQAMREYLAKRSEKAVVDRGKEGTEVAEEGETTTPTDDTTAAAAATDTSSPTTTTTTTTKTTPSSSSSSRRKTDNVGRKPGETFRLCTSSEIRSWCLDLFSSNLTLRPFCKQRQLEGRRSTISRHFKDSGLMALRNARGTKENADVLMTRYLWKREAMMKARMEKMHEANRRYRVNPPMMDVEEEGSSNKEEMTTKEKEPFRIYSNEEIKSWCMAYFSSGVPLRSFCASRQGLHSKRRTINKHFKESGLLELKKSKTATEDDAAAAMDAYLRQRDAKKRRYIQKMHQGRDKMLALKEEQKREEEARAMIFAERETWLREEYRKMCEVFVGGEWTFERFMEFCGRLETSPLKIVHEGYEVTLTRVDPVVELRKVSDMNAATTSDEQGDADNNDEGDKEQGVEEERDGESPKMDVDDKIVSEDDDDDVKDDDDDDDVDVMQQQDDMTSSDDKQQPLNKPVPIIWDKMFI